MRGIFQSEDNKEKELGESVTEGDRRLYMSGGRVSPRSPAVSHVVKLKHERSRSCLEVARLNGTWIY